MSEQTQPQDAVSTDAQEQRSLRQSFRHFRRSRPFWGCIVLLLGGYYVMRPAVGSFALMTELGGGGATVFLLGGGMVTAAFIAFLVPAQRYFPAIMAAMCSVASLPLANLGGWLVGMTLGIIGSGLIFAWTPYTEAEIAADAERQDRRAARRVTSKASRA